MPTALAIAALFGLIMHYQAHREPDPGPENVSRGALNGVVSEYISASENGTFSCTLHTIPVAN